MVANQTGTNLIGDGGEIRERGELTMKDARRPGHIPLEQGISTIGQYSTGTSLYIHEWGIHTPNTPPLSARSSDAADNTAECEAINRHTLIRGAS